MELRSAREIGLMRQAGLVVWASLQAAAKAITPGATTGELDAIVDNVFAACGAEPLFKGVPGKVPFPAATCISVNDEVVHGIPGRRALRSGDIVSIDTGCRLNGWCGDSAWTFPVGEIDEVGQRLLDVTRSTLDLAIVELRTCKRWSEVATKLQRHVEQAGFSVVTSFAGHAIGKTLHEPPQFPNYVSQRLLTNDIPLRPGMVMAIEPMVNEGKPGTKIARDNWTQSTVDGGRSAHFEHTIALTADGPVLLTGPPVAGEALPDGIGASL
jgi:methionyl aminopeptidase